MRRMPPFPLLMRYRGRPGFGITSRAASRRHFSAPILADSRRFSIGTGDFFIVYFFIFTLTILLRSVISLFDDGRVFAQMRESSPAAARRYEIAFKADNTSDTSSTCLCHAAHAGR